MVAVQVGKHQNNLFMDVKHGQ